MRSERLLESVMGVVLVLKDNLEGLTESFQRLVPILEREHQLIKRSALTDLENLTIEKSVVGEEIHQTSERILKSAEELRGLYVEIVPDANAAKGAGLKEAILWLRAIAQVLGEQGLGVQVLQHVTTKLGDVYESLNGLKMRTQPRLDLNVYLTRELLRQHRENIRILQDVQAESNATYDASGTSRKRGSKGVLQVKA